jgi:hypothetical protein
MASTYFNPIKLENLKTFKRKKLKSQLKMTKGLKKNSIKIIISSRRTYIFDLNEIAIENKS